MIENIIEDLKRTHLIVNAEAGHGKSSAIQSLVNSIKRDDPHVIVKVFDIITVWYNNSPLKWRQKITTEMVLELAINKNFLFENKNDCVYELGELPDEYRKYFISAIIQMDFKSRYWTAEKYGLEAVKNLPRIVYVFEESDIYFQSSYLNSSKLEAQILSEFVKSGRNVGLRGVFIVTAAVGELATKLRRRSKHLIGRIISDSDQREYNRMKKWKTGSGRVGLGDVVRKTARFNWIYYNGEMSEPFKFEYHVFPAPKDFVIENTVEQKEVKKPLGWQTYIIIILLALLAVALIFK